MLNLSRLVDRNSSPSRTEYVPLMTMEGADIDEEGKTDDTHTIKMSRDGRERGLSAFTTATIWTALLVSILAFLASATSFLRVLSLHSDGHSGAKNGPLGAQSFDLGLLRHPSLYLGLERAPEIKVRLRAERILAALNPSMPMHGDAHNEHGQEGETTHGAQGSDNDYVSPTRARRVNSLYPDESLREARWVLVSDWETTLLQFDLPQANKSSNLERQRCTFVAAFPTRSELRGRLLTIEGAPTLTIYRIIDGDKIGMENERMTWNNRPSRGPPIGDVGVKFGERAETEKFGCESGETIVLEVANAKGEKRCRVEYEVDGSSAALGFSLLINGS